MLGTVKGKENDNVVLLGHVGWGDLANALTKLVSVTPAICWFIGPLVVASYCVHQALVTNVGLVPPPSVPDIASKITGQSFP